MQLLPFLRLLRYQNLLMIGLTQYLIKYFLLEPFGVATTLNAWQFLLLVLSVLCIAGAGNIINDIHDVQTDSINRPRKLVIGNGIRERTAYNWFFALNIIGVGIGFYLSNLVGQPGFTGLFVLPSALLYLYAAHLKRVFLIGNLVVSLLVGLAVLMVGIFDLLPAITPQNLGTQRVFFSILLDYALFAFLINLLREIVKDQEDIKGDYNAGMQTLPVLLGRERSNKVIFSLALFPLAGLVYYIYMYLFQNQVAVLYVLFLIMAPLLYFIVKIPSAKSPKDFHRLSLCLKGILAAGLFSIGLYRFIIL